MEISKSDWKLFREKVPIWQERYMEQLIGEYMTLLRSGEKASDKFWALEERINQDRRRPGVMLEMSKSNVISNIVSLIHDHVITTDDLHDFSDDFQNAVSFFVKR